MKKFSLIITAALLFLSLVSGLFYFIEKEISFCFPESVDCRKNNRYRIKDYTIIIDGHSETTGDKGAAELIVYINGETAGSLSTVFNFDTLMHTPPGYAAYRWIDGDIFPDLRIKLATGSSWYAGSADGRLHRL